MALSPDKPDRLTVLLSRHEIAARVAEMGAQISRDFAGEDLILVGVLKGSVIFLSDLARSISLSATLDFMAAGSYGPHKESSGTVQLTKDLEHPITGKNVILVEDILDTGRTAHFLLSMLRSRDPKTLRFATLLDKPGRRAKTVSADYVGFTIPDRFVVGYGLDVGEKYRNLPDICVFSDGS